MDPMETVDKIFDADLFQPRPSMDSVEKNLQESSEEKKNLQSQEESSMDAVEAVEKIFDTDLSQLRPSMDFAEKNLQLQEESSEEEKKNLQESSEEQQNLQMQEEYSVEAVEKIFDADLFHLRPSVKKILQESSKEEKKKNLQKKKGSLMDRVKAVEKILNYSFSNKSLLKDAVNQHDVGLPPYSFKRLEFLGDSVLGVAISSYLHLTFPDLKGDELRELQRANTCNDKFARVAVNRGLVPFLICNHRQNQKIKVFSEAVSKEDDLVWYQGSVEAPKILADFVEAIAGAVYIDVDFDLQRLWEILKGLLEPLFMPDDFRRLYQPLVTLRRLGKKRVLFRYYNMEKRKVVAKVYIDNKFIATGHATKLICARIAAAKEALQKLSECMPVQKIIDERSSLDVKKEVEEPSLDFKKEADKGSLDLEKNVEERSIDLKKEADKEADRFYIQNRSCTRKLQLQKILEEKKSLQIQESLEEKKSLQIQESLEEKKSLQMDSLEAVEKILNYSFSNKSLLKEAITQKSGMKHRLEILGEMALRHAFTEYLYFEYPTLAPNGLEPLRSANTCIEKFARVAVNHGLDNILQKSLCPDFDKKVKLFSEAVSKEDGPVPNGGLVTAPRILSGLLESVVGAVYVDVNFNVSRLWEICKGLFEPIYTPDDLRLQPQPVQAQPAQLQPAQLQPQLVNIGNTEIEDAKVKLSEICRKRKWPDPMYSVVSEDIWKGFVCSAVIETQTEEGTLFIKGDSKRKKKLAEHNSASHMIRALEFSIKDDLRKLESASSLNHHGLY